MELNQEQKDKLKKAKGLIAEGMKIVEDVKDNLEEPGEDDEENDVPDEDDSIEEALSEMVDALDTVDTNLSDLIA